MLNQNITDNVKNYQVVKLIDENAPLIEMGCNLQEDTWTEELDTIYAEKCIDAVLDFIRVECKRRADINNKVSEFLSNVGEVPQGGKGGSGVSDANHFIDWNSITNLLSEFSDHMDALSLIQKGAVIHICFSISILFSLFTLIGVYFGDWFINYFNLELKYPRLATFFRLRRKFQNYYFIWNSLYILFILLIVISFNIFILLN